jgi:hypothetical protein
MHACGRYMFDHQMVLPEYLVEFQYELAPACPRLARQPAVASPLDLDGALSQVWRLAWALISYWCSTCRRRWSEL